MASEVGFIEAFVRVYFRRLFHFRGTSSRPEFWWAALGGLIFVGPPAWIIEAAIFNLPSDPAADTSLGLLGLVLLAIYLWSFFAWLSAGLRRLRDAGFSPWLYLLMLIPLIGFIALLVLWVQPTKREEPPLFPRG